MSWRAHWRDHVDPLQLTLAQRAIIERLWWQVVPGGYVSSAKLADTLYRFDHSMPEDPESTIRVHVHLLRKRLEGTPLDIESRKGPGGGYRLVSRSGYQAPNEEAYAKALRISVQVQRPRLNTAEQAVIGCEETVSARKKRDDGPRIICEHCGRRCEEVFRSRPSILGYSNYCSEKCREIETRVPEGPKEPRPLAHPKKPRCRLPPSKFQELESFKPGIAAKGLAPFLEELVPYVKEYGYAQTAFAIGVSKGTLLGKMYRRNGTQKARAR